MAKVFLSAGHGGSDPGAVAYGLKEKDIKNAAKWAFKTSNPLKTLFIYAKDGIKYFKRNS